MDSQFGGMPVETAMTFVIIQKEVVVLLPGSTDVNVVQQVTQSMR